MPLVIANLFRRKRRPTGAIKSVTDLKTGETLRFHTQLVARNTKGRIQAVTIVD